MKTKAEIIEGKELADKFRQAGKKVEDKIDKALMAAGLLVERDVKQSFGVSPSVPGEPPGVLTGRLRASIATRVIPGNALVGTRVEYARALEFGYKPRNLAARPFLIPALERNREEIKKILYKGLTEAMTEVFKKGFTSIL
jgi:phage gpG-like protein